jgi:hypothetical protein
MKTSNKIILLAIMIAFGSLLFYNFKLKSKYESKGYKDRFHDMDYIAVAGLENLYIQSANRIGIQIEYGIKEGLWVPKELKGKIKILSSGDHLKLDLVADADGKAPVVKSVFLILIAKDLNRIVASHTDRKKETNSSMSNMRLKGFTLSKLDLQVSSDTHFYLDKVQIDTLNAIVGGDDYAGKAELILPFNTSVNAANFNIGINGVVNLQGAKVLKIQSTNGEH